jgi:transcriptional regulator with XRE-family HTH domain
MATQNKLGEFIRAHRERIQPEDIGLPDGGRRRTPGLRREELAQLCSVSPTWLTWLEQGRQVSASAKTLTRIAEVMHLTAAERAYLFRLADKLDPASESADEEPHADLNALVKSIKTPAYVLNRQWDAVAWNSPAQALFTSWLIRKKTAVPNLLRYMFLDPAAPRLIIDWNDRATRLVAEFRADCGKHADQEPVKSLVNELSLSSEDFRQRWNSQNVVDREGGLRRFRHPDKGELRFEQTTLHPATRRDLKLVILLSI